MPHIWTVDEIQRLPEFGSGMGWFYGLVRNERGKVRLYEILPGMGYTTPWLRDMPRFWRVVKDVLRYKP